MTKIKQPTNAQVMTALDVLTRHFYDAKVIERRDGTTDIVNALEYAQNGLVKDLCYAAHRAVAYTVTNLEPRETTLKDQLQGYNKTTKAKEDIAYSVDLVGRIRHEKATKEDFLDMCMEQHRILTGKAWEPSTKKTDTKDLDVAALALEMGFPVADIGVKAPFEPSIDGVEVDSDEAAAA
jgi:hypothetical protein